VTDPDDHAEALSAVARRLHEHPGYREHMLTEGLAQTVNAVVIPNHVELLRLLDAPAHDPALAVELFQNVRRPDAREAYIAATTRALHNYAATALTLIEHTRRVMRDRTGPTADEYERRKNEIRTHPEVPFVTDLRQFVQHRKLPFLGHNVTIAAGDVPVGRIDLSVEDLLDADVWSSRSKRFIRSHGDALPIRPVVARHGELVVNLTNWLHNELAAANAAAIPELNEIVAERNAILAGLGPDEARALTDAVTQMRSSPNPPASAEEMLRRMRPHSPAEHKPT
jgi:hypothetical protein